MARALSLIDRASASDEIVSAPGFGGPASPRPRPVPRPGRTLTMRLGDETLELAPGTFACVPPGSSTRSANRTEEPVRCLDFNPPAGWENDMRDRVATLAAANPPSAIGGIASRYE
jgi:hypothetical protein